MIMMKLKKQEIHKNLPSNKNLNLKITNIKLEANPLENKSNQLAKK